MVLMRYVIMVVAAALIGLTGCGGRGGQSIDREGLTNEVLAADPGFRRTLDRYQELANRIKTYERELALKRSTIEQQIEQIKKELAAATQSVESKIADVKKRLEPDRKELELALSMAGEEQRAKRAQRASVGRTIAQLRKATKQSGGTWTPDERAKREAQLNELVRDTARLDQELGGIKQHVRLLKIKLLLLKL